MGSLSLPSISNAYISFKTQRAVMFSRGNCLCFMTCATRYLEQHARRDSGFLISFSLNQPFPSVLLFLRSYKHLAVVKGRPGCYSNSVAGGDRSLFISYNSLWRVFNVSKWPCAWGSSGFLLWDSTLPRASSSGACCRSGHCPTWRGRGWERGAACFPRA